MSDIFNRRQRPRPHSTRRVRIEVLEDRTAPALIPVTTLLDSGVGSLRKAIADANSTTDDDVIEFQVAGTIKLTSGALPAITDTVDFDGTTAPGFSVAPVVEIDMNNFSGLTFDAGSAGSEVLSLAIVNASNAGITLNAGGMNIVANYIGLRLDGVTIAGNAGNGILINASSDNNLIGVITGPNVISGNGGNGILIDGASGNRLRANRIGTDVTGTLDRGNALSGVVMTNGASDNILGGVEPGNPPGTKPDEFSGAQPPEGNIISGNAQNGVLLTNGATRNNLSGNFIGADASGIRALGNDLDGVAITNGSNQNALVGTFVNLDPFIFYNVVSGNKGNGLRVQDSNGTIIQANFFGLGSDNNTGVPNVLSGVVIEGSSANTVFGGVIPLGNVVACNLQNGIVVKDAASGFVSFNTFSGVAAFSTNMALGNRGSGILITTTGGGTVVKTSVFSRNGDAGVKIAGNASGVQIVQCLIGTNTDGKSPMPNEGNGIEITDNAHDNVIGGIQTDFSIAPRNVISSNEGYGIAVLGNAHDNQINFSYIGVSTMDAVSLPNIEGGVLLGGLSSNTTIGSTDPVQLTLISGNAGDGVTIDGSSGNTIFATLIGVDTDGAARPNLGNGIRIVSGSNNVIGGVLAGEDNSIAFNQLNGISIKSGQNNTVVENSIHDNVLRGIALAPGSNNSVPAPTITSVVFLTGALRVSGVVNGATNSTYTIQVYSDSQADTSQFTQGKVFLGTTTATTNGSGVGVFTIDISSTALDVSQTASSAVAFTATATDNADNSSEFSAPQTAFVFLDVNADGIRQTGESGLAGRTVFLDTNGNRTLDPSETSAVTAANGSFTLVGAGTVRQVLFAGDQDVAGGVGVRLNSSVAVIPAVDDLFADAGTPQETYIGNLYRGILGREASAAEVAAWLSPLQAGVNVADAIWKSVEHRVQQIDGYYRDYLGRVADDAGRLGWLATFQAGAIEEDVVVSILSSAEYQAGHAAATAFVDGVYEAILGRERAPGEGTAWESLAQSSGRAAVVRQILASGEAQLRAVNGFYVGILNRQASSAESQGWRVPLSSGTLTYGGVAVQFFISPEFTTPRG